MTMNTEIQTLIETFAKQNKVSREKLKTFAELLAEKLPANVSTVNSFGRKPSEHALKFRESVALFSGKTVTAREVADTIGIPPSHAINGLIWLEKSGGATFVGKRDRPAGARGPRENVYTVL